jgi:uncharacterized BrkB/YihY/UPF0761 family membrane protein
MKIVEKIFDVVFSFGTFFVLGCALFAYLILQIAEGEKADKELLAKQTAYCYSLGQILVKTDAGRHCVAPESLTVIK